MLLTVGALALGFGASREATAAGAADTPAAHQAAQLRQQWAAAWSALAALADSGERDAARLALQLWQAGVRLPGAAFEATPERRSRWQRVADDVAAEPPWEPGPHGC